MTVKSKYKQRWEARRNGKPPTNRQLNGERPAWWLQIPNGVTFHVTFHGKFNPYKREREDE